jgi:predicted nicotinamide N-methyase
MMGMAGSGPGAGRAATTARRLAGWRRRLEARRPVRDLPLTIPGAARPYLLAAPADPDAVLDEADPSGDWHMPYWATPWASGLFLGEVVLSRAAAVRGRRVLELGCGLGATAAATLEAQGGPGGLGTFLAADVFPETLAYCRYNALRNAAVAPRTLLADWRVPEGRAALAGEGPFDLVLAADVLYDPEDVAPLLELAPRLVASRGASGGASGGELWLAEPGRATSGRFVGTATELGWATGATEAERDWPAGAGHALVRVHFLRPRPTPGG